MGKFYFYTHNILHQILRFSDKKVNKLLFWLLFGSFKLNINNVFRRCYTREIKIKIKKSRNKINHSFRLHSCITQWNCFCFFQSFKMSIICLGSILFWTNSLKIFSWYGNVFQSMFSKESRKHLLSSHNNLVFPLPTPSPPIWNAVLTPSFGPHKNLNFIKLNIVSFEGK